LSTRSIHIDGGSTKCESAEINRSSVIASSLLQYLSVPVAPNR
jgi:hypothetical protein